MTCTDHDWQPVYDRGHLMGYRCSKCGAYKTG